MLMMALASATLLFSRSATLATKHAKWSTCHLYLESHPNSVLSRITGPRQPGPRNLEQGCLSYSVRLLCRRTRYLRHAQVPERRVYPAAKLGPTDFWDYNTNVRRSQGLVCAGGRNTGKGKGKKKVVNTSHRASGAWLPSSLNSLTQRARKVSTFAVCSVRTPPRM